MTALLHRLLHDRPRTRRFELPSRIRVSPAPAPRDTLLAATDERLASSTELARLRSLHPRRIAGR